MINFVIVLRKLCEQSFLTPARKIAVYEGLGAPVVFAECLFYILAQGGAAG